MMSDVPIGVMLSRRRRLRRGVRRHGQARAQVRAYTVGFAGGGEEADEIEAARRTAPTCSAPRTASVLIGEREYLDALPESMLTVEEPIGTTSALAVEFVARLMRPRCRWR